MHLRFSQELKSLLEQLAERPLTLQEMLAETSERGFSLMIGLLVLPFLLPMPPGLTTILGPGCLLISLQMALGRTAPWLPQKLAHFQFPKLLTQQLLSSLKRVTRLLERVVRPRWGRIAESAHIAQINGLCISWLTILLMTPVPMTNPIPTVGILLFVIAMLEADGLLMCIGYLFTLATTGIFGVMIYILWRAPEMIQRLMS